MSAPTRLIPIAGAADELLTEEASRAIIDRAMRMSGADAVTVNVSSNVASNTRFAANSVSTAGIVSDINVAVTSAFGAKRGTVVTNGTSDDALRAAVKQSETLAKLSPDDPEAMPNLGPQAYQKVNAAFADTEAVDATALARAAMTAIEPARKAGDLSAAGYLVVTSGTNALGNSDKLFAYHRSTNVNYTLTVRTADGTGSGWAGGEHNDWRRVDIAKISATAIDKARKSRNPFGTEPGRYTVILEPQAVGDLLQLISFYSDARSSDEGRGPFTKPSGGNKLGEQIADPRVTIYADPADPMVLTQPWDGDGLPLGRQTLIENGKLTELYYSRFWAKKMGKTPTGAPTSLIMKGGNDSLDDMIAGTRRGVLVTRLWYLREVDPRTIRYTGLTRDGTFLIENGKILKAIKNFRFNDSPLVILNNLDAIGKSVRLAGTEAGGAVVVPPLKVRDFNFTSTSEAV
jgi:predicted Zn-dependent protease